MKVALLGNMNNNNYSMLRYLRDKKIEAFLFLFDDEADIFDPINDTFENKYFDYIIQLEWGSYKKFLKTPSQKIFNDLKNFKFLIGCGLAPAYLEKINRKLDVFVPYGADLDYYTKYNITYPNRIINLWISVFYQKKGIKKADIWHLEYSNNKYDKIRDRLRGKSKRWFFSVPYVYLNEYNDQNISKQFKNTNLINKLKVLKSNNNLILVSPTRHVWRGLKSDPNMKGTNYLIEGLKIFKDNHPNISFKLITFKYGKDFFYTQKLVEKLDLQNNVLFFDITPRKDIINIIFHSDIVCGEFQHSFLSAGVYFECISLKKNLLCFRNDNEFLKNYQYLYPILNAKYPNEIASKIYNYYSNKNYYNDKAKQGLIWYKKYVVDQSIDHYINLLNKINEK